MRVLAIGPRGLERVLRHEIAQAGGTQLRVKTGAVLFEGTEQSVAQLLVSSRTASRVLMELAAAPCASVAEYEHLLRSVRWPDWIGGGTIALESNIGARSPLRNSLYASQLGKDAICDVFRHAGRPRPTVDLRDPDFRVVVHWDGEALTLALDCTGEPLHRRGYRAATDMPARASGSAATTESDPATKPTASASAPLRENVAAGILALAHADVKRPFLDPFCGGGTLAIEQALRSLNRAPNAHREFVVERWPWAHQLQAALRDARAQADAQARTELMAPVLLSDADAQAVRAAQQCVARARVPLQPVRADGTGVAIPPDAVLVSNLPYGQRVGAMGPHGGVSQLYRALGAHIARTARDVRVVLLVGDEQRAVAALGWGPPGRRWPVWNGGLQAAVLRWDFGSSPP